MKTRDSRPLPISKTLATCNDHVQRRQAIPSQASTEHSATQLHASERMVAQRQQVDAVFGSAAQRQQGGVEDELPAQGRFADVTQRAVEEELQMKTAQLQDGLEEEDPLQGRFAPLQAKAEPNQTGMPDGLRNGIESLSGMDMSSVRVHANSDKPAQLNALAYAQGNDIHLAPGQEQHLPHEAWHVVQQREGRVQATTQLQGVGINDDQALESEADVMGARALSSAAQRSEDKA